MKINEGADCAQLFIGVAENRVSVYANKRFGSTNFKLTRSFRRYENMRWHNPFSVMYVEKK